MKRPDIFDEYGLDFTPEQKRAVYHALGELAAAGCSIDLRDILRLFAPSTAMPDMLDREVQQRFFGNKENYEQRD